ncbi:glycosyltransferase [Rhodococcoides kyotonense]|uniref:4,4'-diaponeurosporenoate glycosyltransferase n=1 Tax=Rhodococcoides kyotonense TaxID=398843 RepID=A0A239JL32_9NOCA|nr:glycosyltransferase family 2 protein [Rhodococcus kyotonensis]SNT06282.1 Glycosyl transferase family 2 [Rhodococcus kyotonensis]
MPVASSTPGPTWSAAQSGRTALIDFPTDVRRAVVVVPVHDEEDLLQACLGALGEAQCHLESIDVQTVVVLDSCSDRSESIAVRWAREHSARSVISVAMRNVGAARAAGFAAQDGAPDTWFATTDADSVTRPDWLASQIAHARRGAGAVAGTVRVDLDALPESMAAAYRSSYHDRPGHRHVHGANLGVRADAYRRIGGFAPLATDEDVDLIRRLEKARVPVVYACDSPVSTSNRLHGRAPDGFAAHLLSLDEAAR